MKLPTHRFRLMGILLIPAFAFSLIFTSEPSAIHFDKTFADEDTLRVATTPALMVQDEQGVSHPIELHTLKVNVVVLGNIAVTTMDMTFYNHEDRILEGELYFPLGEGQTVSRFALDLDGKLREGVIVEKEKGQQVFESVIRQNIDPGLLEWTQGNNFKARVYPIPSKGYKRVVLAYEQELDAMDQNYLYTLPMDYERAIPNFSFDLEAIARPVAPVNDPESPVELAFTEIDGNYRTNFSRQNFQPGKGIRIGLPWPKNKLAIFTEKVPDSPGDYYYYVSLEPRKMQTEEEKPKRVALIWDASSSAMKRSMETELNLLKAFVRESGVQEVDLYALRNDLQKVEHFTLSGNADALVKRIQMLKADGASAYRSIDFTALNAQSILIFGDGLNNFGVPLQTQSFPVPINTVCSASSANHSYLRFLSSASGGAYINLAKTEFSVALKQMQGQSFLYKGNGHPDSYPSLPVTMGDQIQVVGIIHGVTEIDFRFGTRDEESMEHLQIDPEKHLSDYGIVRRIWAQKKLAELDIYPEQNAEAILELGKNFGLVTRYTSLIVLDQLEDYVRHEIVPPTEMQADYFAQIETIQKDEQAKREAHLATVKSNFESYLTWWNSTYSTERTMPVSDTIHNIMHDLDSVTILNMMHDLDPDALYDGQSGAGAGNDALQLEAVELERVGLFVDADIVLRESEELLDSEKDKENISNKVSIELAAWTPDAPYLDTLRKLSGEQRYETYLRLKKEHGHAPSFYLDVADIFLETGEQALALRILSNIAELELENHELLRILAHRLDQLKYYDLAIEVFKEVKRMRSEEPQSYRDLGLCLEKKGEYQAAIELLYEVAMTEWDARFPDIEGIALVEMNHIIGTHRSALDLAGIDPELIRDLPLDVRIILTWDTDNCDMDLWVTDPWNEKCFYSHKLTELGGRMSNDFTGGYGPEMFTLKNAAKGKYTVQIDYYGSRSQKANGPTTIQMKLITNYGKPNERVQEITRRLSEAKEVLDIGDLIFE